MPRSLFWRHWTIARVRLASWIMGGGYLGYVSWLCLVRDRAESAVNADGAVTLADCEALADVLYRPVPSCWTLTVSRAEACPDAE